MRRIEKRMLAVARAQGQSFTELVRLSGLEPAKDIRFLPLAGVDFSGCNLAGYDFTGAQIHGGNFDGALIADAMFDNVQRTLPELEKAKDYAAARERWRDTSRRSDRTITDPSWQEIWGGEILPEWVDDYGTDTYGRWSSFSIEGVVQVLRYCPPGQFLMGSPEDEVGRNEFEDPQMEITIQHGYWLSDSTVHQEFYKIVTQENPSEVRGRNLPVNNVSWSDANSFAEMLNRRYRAMGCCLPSEALWEYACRAGTTTPYNGDVAISSHGRSIVRNEAVFKEHPTNRESVSADHSPRIAQVKGGEFRPNNWGFWHMHGNIAEWCYDAFSSSHEGASLDGSPRQVRIEGRVQRGGRCRYGMYDCRSASRQGFPQHDHSSDLGFRLAIIVEPL